MTLRDKINRSNNSATPFITYRESENGLSLYILN